MARQTSLFGKISGKLGAVVFSTSGGETISREYNPHVANPSTLAQVNQRAKMKLMSQLSATLAPVIAMTKDGLVSKRNKFTKINFPKAFTSDGVASISYENIQLTEGNAALPQITFGGSSGSYYLELAEAADESVSRVVYAIYKKTQEAKLQLFMSEIVETPGASGKFRLDLATLPTDNFVFYAYGMKDMNAQATANYGNLQVTTATDLAQLVASRKISMTDYQFTETRGATSNNGSPIEPVPEGKVRVYVTANGNGTVTGAGLYDVGAAVTVTATPNDPQVVFDGWKLNGSSAYVSREASYTFNPQVTTDLVAYFHVQEI